LQDKVVLAVQNYTISNTSIETSKVYSGTIMNSDEVVIDIAPFLE